MVAFTLKIMDRLEKYYSISKEEAAEIINEEWDYIEKEFIEGSSVKETTKTLISFYMVA